MEPEDKIMDEAPERRRVPFALKTVSVIVGDDDAEIGLFEGLASTFGDTDLDGDRIEPGAFAAAAADPAKVRMLWQHDARSPIGIWEKVEETDQGLLVRGRLILDVQQAREAHALLKAGAVDALSIGFMVPPGGAVFDGERRVIKSIELIEISIVTFPANPKARINRIKAVAADGRLPAPRMFEAYLRDSGFSRSQAKAIIAEGYRTIYRRDAGPAIARRDAESEALDYLVASLTRVADLMTQ